MNLPAQQSWKMENITNQNCYNKHANLKHTHKSHNRKFNTTWFDRNVYIHGQDKRKKLQYDEKKITQNSQTLTLMCFPIWLLA